MVRRSRSMRWFSVVWLVLPLALLVGSSASAVEPFNPNQPDPNKVIDLRADKLRVTGGKEGPGGVTHSAVKEGSVVELACDWSAHLDGAGYWTTKVEQTWQVVLQADGHTVGFGPASMPAGTQLGKKTTSSSGWKVPTPSDPVPYESSSKTSSHPTSVTGSLGPMSWKAAGVGVHQLTCTIPKTGFEEKNLANNVAKAVVEVVAGPVSATSGGPQSVQPVGPGINALPTSGPTRVGRGDKEVPAQPAPRNPVSDPRRDLPSASLPGARPTPPNPTLNPQPEVPSARLPGAVPAPPNPTLNPQPEVPSARLPGAVPAPPNPTLNPQPEVPSPKTRVPTAQP